MLSVAYQEAIVEVLSILSISPKEEVNKIPKKLMNFFTRNASTSYTFYIKPNTLIKDMSLKKETHSLLAMLYIKYLCTPEEKAECDTLLRKNHL